MHSTRWLTDSLAGVSDDQNKATPFASVFVAQAIETAQRGTVLLQRVNQLPLIHELDPRRHKQTDLFSQGLFQQPASKRGALSVTDESQRSQRRWLKGRETAFGSVEKGGRWAHGPVVVGGQGTSERCRSFVCAETAEQATKGVGYRICDVLKEAAFVLVVGAVFAVGVGVTIA